MLRTPAPGQTSDPKYVAQFDGRKRMFWAQIQGRFLVQPQGTIFLGGELDGELELGIVTRNMAGMILGVIRALSSGLHHSFGKTHDEKAHIVFPVLRMADRWVTTPSGETPPQLGVRFHCNFQKRVISPAVFCHVLTTNHMCVCVRKLSLLPSDWTIA